MTFPVVAVAASAGGLEAILELLTALPAKTGMAYVILQHLDPDHESQLPEILGSKTALPVAQIQDGVAVKPDHVYVIPPNAGVKLRDDRLCLSPRAQGPGRHMPADMFLKSLAHERTDGAIGVILSGGDSDGALGTQSIKHCGGITFAQEPATARFPSMPRNAIDTGCVDFVLRPNQIAHELVRLGQHPYLRPAPVDRPVADLGNTSVAVEEEHLRQIFRRLRTAHGVDFTHYKRTTLQRRLARRMALQKIDDLAGYGALLDSDLIEATNLYQDFLIRVTGFFRDPEAFDGLREHVFPNLSVNRSSKEPIRIWVPGCASGEEVYSIAMALVEFLGEDLLPDSIQMFGTDVSEAAIEQARPGIYPDSIAQDIPGDRLTRFFVKQSNGYRIAKSIRDLCVFARQDVTRDPPFSRLDLVSCRNLLIYLDNAAQRRIMHVFHYALNPKGVLMLGPSESVGPASDLFEQTDKQHRLYTRKAVSPGAGLDLSRQSTPYNRQRATVDLDIALALEPDSALRDADRVLLARYAPASLVVDAALNILQFRGETGPYLEHASGIPSLNLHRVARPELLVEIAAAHQQARDTNSEARRDGLRIDERHAVSIEVIPLKTLNADQTYLIVFEDGSRPPSSRREQQRAKHPLADSEKDRRFAQAEREVAAMRSYLQITMEEHEVVKEQLKSAHEEVLSANEEFQSTNEELETSKEELQSANEELTTTNDELRNRNQELAVLNAEVEMARDTAERARAYADSIIETVREPLIVLDEHLHVLRANQAFYTDFKVRSEDTAGRRLYEVGNGQWNIPVLRDQLEAVLTNSDPLTESEVAHDFPTIGPKIMNLTARKISGDSLRTPLILLAIEDVTEQRAKTTILSEGNRRKDEFLAMLAHELRNPLTPITHAIHLLRRADTDPTAMKLHEMIERQTARLVRLVDELLDVARIGRGMLELKREYVDLTTLVRHATEASRTRVKQRRHALTLALPKAALHVEGDSVRLEQVIANLLENAAKYTEPGGRIAVTLSRQNDDAVLSVRDTGIGIAPEMLQEIFDPFTQVDGSLARSGGGLGLGLTVVRRVLELHGGRIEARSAGLGKGSEFVVRLAAIQPQAAVAEPQSSTAAPEDLPAASGRRVLIVDDNVDSAESVALLARLWGHEAVVAKDALEALVLVETFRPETVLLDIGLPGMDGYELARHLREDPRYRELHLVAMTGYGRPEDRDEARAAGFDVHLIKPAAIGELQQLLATGGGPAAK